MTPGAGGRIKLAPWGWYTRFMLAAYIRHIFIVVAALMSISLTTDIATWVWRVISDNPDATWWWLAYRIGWIVLLRATDLLPLIMPIACFVGVLWAEVSQTWSRERLTVWNTGRSPAQCVVPVVLLAIGMSFIQFAFDAHLRPAAVMAMEGRFRPAEPGREPPVPTGKTWVAAGDDLIQARIGAGPPPLLRDVTVYRLTREGRLREIVTAETAAPTPERPTWTFRNGRIWQLQTPPTGSRVAIDQERPSDAGFDRLDLALAVAPLWLTAYGIHPQYLPYRFLRALATAEEAPYPTAQYRVWFHGRYARSLLPGGMALLATSLSLLLIAYRIRVGAIFAIALAGYAAHVLTKVATVFGEHNVLNPVFAAWVVPLLLLLVSCAILAMLERRQAYRVAAA